MTKKACCRGFLSLLFAYLFEDRDKLIAPSGYLLFNEIPLDHLTMRSTFILIGFNSPNLTLKFI